MTFSSCEDLIVQNLKFKNSQKMHLSFEDCRKVRASRLDINAPKTSPNTDGIHIARTTYMDVTNSEIKTGKKLKKKNQKNFYCKLITL